MMTKKSQVVLALVGITVFNIVLTILLNQYDWFKVLMGISYGINSLSMLILVLMFKEEFKFLNMGIMKNNVLQIVLQTIKTVAIIMISLIYFNDYYNWILLIMMTLEGGFVNFKMFDKFFQQTIIK